MEHPEKTPEEKQDDALLVSVKETVDEDGSGDKPWSIIECSGLRYTSDGQRVLEYQYRHYRGLSRFLYFATFPFFTYRLTKYESELRRVGTQMTWNTLPDPTVVKPTGNVRPIEHIWLDAHFMSRISSNAEQSNDVTREAAATRSAQEGATPSMVELDGMRYLDGYRVLDYEYRHYRGWSMVAFLLTYPYFFRRLYRYHTLANQQKWDRNPDPTVIQPTGEIKPVEEIWRNIRLMPELARESKRLQEEKEAHESRVAGR